MLQRKLYLCSKYKPEQRFYSLYDKLCREDILWEAYYNCKANKGGAGVDGMTFDILTQGNKSQQLIEEIKQQLKDKVYKAQPVKRVEIPKDNGKTRCLGIPTIRDRIVQMAMSIVMQPIFEPHLHGHSYGYRPKRSAAQAVQVIESSLKQGYQHVLDADLSGYFDNIPHKRLMEKVERKISDQSFLNLLNSFIKAPHSVATSNGRRKIVANKAGIGTPQGGVVSPLLANIYLNDFCLKIHERTPCRIVTYADDFVILHKEAFNQRQLDWITIQLSKEGLTLNQNKTHCVNMSAIGNEFDFLGFNFKLVNGFYRGSLYYKIQPSKKSQKKLKDKLRDIVKHRTSQSLDILIIRVNRILRGWKNYFNKVGYPRQVFFKMDWFLVARFYRWSRNRSQRRSLYLSQNATDKLRKAGLAFLQPVKAKVMRRG